jgi:hypothetical protein
MTENHPITPPSELLQLWFEQHHDYDKGINELLIEAAQYGADQELQACIEWMTRMGYWGDDGKAIPALYAARRPKPLSLKEQAMRVLLECGYTLDGRMELEPEDIHIIQRALESIDE